MNKGIKFAAFLLVVLVLAAVIFLFAGANDDEFLTEVSLYFFDESKSTVVEEKREITYDEAEDIIPKIVKEIGKGPKQAGNKRIVKKGVKVTDIFYEEDAHAVIDLNKKFLSDNNTSDLLSAYSIIKSVCSVAQITGISYVKLTVDGDDITTNDGKNISYLSYDDIKLSGTEESNIKEQVMLYFPSNAKSGFSAEIREIEVSETKTLEQCIVEELIKGPKSKELKPLSFGKLISVETKDSVCFVNFDFSFVEKNMSGKAEDAVYSVVNSLTELETVSGVQFLIDGKKVETVGKIDISGVLQRK